MTWGKENGDSANCASYPAICTYTGDQDRLSQSYQEMGQLNHATVAPAGEAWRRVKAQSTAFSLYQADHSHPTIWGTYLVASVFYEILFQKSVLADTFITSGISTSDALLLRQAAHTTVSDSLSKWLRTGHIPVAFFSKTVIGSSVIFTSTSINGQQFSWNYGDSYHGTGVVSNHNYTTSGTYPVTLQITDHCKIAYYTDSVSIAFSTGIAPSSYETIKVYPNPTQSYIYIDKTASEQGGEIIVKLFNTLGYCVQSFKSNSPLATIPSSDFPSGLYFMEITTAKSYFTYPIIIEH